MAFAVISVLLLLHLRGYGPRSWDTASTYTSDTIKQQLGLSTTTTQKPPVEIVIETKKFDANLPPPPTSLPQESTALRFSTDKPTPREPPPPLTPAAPSTSKATVEHAAASTGPPDSEDAQKGGLYIGAPLAPAGLEQLLMDEGEGNGRWEPPPSRSSVPAIYWSKPAEHFPVTGSTIKLPTGTPKPIPRIQHLFEKKSERELEDQHQKKAAVKEAFVHAWDGYKTFAWGHDELKPVSNATQDPFGGWGATLIDTLDTLWLMGLKEDFEAAVKHMETVEFTTSLRPDIPVFETTIRYVGGLIAAYDVSGHKYQILLDKAVELADIIMSAFDTPNRMPVTFFKWTPMFARLPRRAGKKTVLSEIGSLTVEFTRLAQLTKEAKYYDAVARITDAFDELQDETLVPGLFPQFIDASGCKKEPFLPKGPQKGGRPASEGQSDLVDEINYDLPASSTDGVKNPSSTSTSSSDEMTDDTFVAGQPGVGHITVYDDTKPKPAKNEAPSNKKEAAVGKLKVGTDDDKTTKPEVASSRKEPSVGKLRVETDEGTQIPEGNVPLDLPEPLTFTPKEPTVGKLRVEEHKKRNTKRQLAIDEEEPDWKTIHNTQKAIPPTAQGPGYKCSPQGLVPSAGQGIESFTLGGRADSLYEYFPKEYMLLGGLVDQYKKMYVKAADAALENIIYRPMLPNEDDILFAGAYEMLPTRSDDGTYDFEGRLKAEGTHLTCFAGAMFAMAGKIFDRPEDVDVGAKLTEGCVWAYQSTATGIMPEGFQVIACESRSSCPWNQTLYHQVLDPYQGHREQTYWAQVSMYQSRIAEAATATSKVSKESVAKTVGADGPRATKELRGPRLGDNHADVSEATTAGAGSPRATEELRGARTVNNMADVSEEASAEAAEFVGDRPTPAKTSAAVATASTTPVLDSDDKGLKRVKRQLEAVDTLQSARTTADTATASSSTTPSTTTPPAEVETLTADAIETLSPEELTAPKPPTKVKPAQQVYSPPPFESHEDFVRNRISEERLPPGMIALDSRKYILR